MKVKIRIGDLVITVSAPTNIEIEVEPSGGRAPTAVGAPSAQPTASELKIDVVKEEIPGIPEPEIEEVASESPAPRGDAEPVVAASAGDDEASEVLGEFFRESDREAASLREAVEKRESEPDKIRQELIDFLRGQG